MSEAEGKTTQLAMNIEDGHQSRYGSFYRRGKVKKTYSSLEPPERKAT